MDSLGVIDPTTNSYNSNEPKITNPFLAVEQKIAKEVKGFRIFREVVNEVLIGNLKQN